MKVERQNERAKGRRGCDEDNAGGVKQGLGRVHGPSSGLLPCQRAWFRAGRRRQKGSAALAFRNLSMVCSGKKGKGLGRQ